MLNFTDTGEEAKKTKITTVDVDYLNRIIEESTMYNKTLHYLKLKTKEQLLQYLKEQEKCST